MACKGVELLCPPDFLAACSSPPKKGGRAELEYVERFKTPLQVCALHPEAEVKAGGRFGGREGMVLVYKFSFFWGILFVGFSAGLRLRHALRSEWPFIIIIISAGLGHVVLRSSGLLLGFRLCGA